MGLHRRAESCGFVLRMHIAVSLDPSVGFVGRSSLGADIVGSSRFPAGISHCRKQRLLIMVVECFV